MTLSGMSNFDQMKENIAIYETDRPLDEAEMEKLTAVAADMLDKIVPCTACSYCVSHCPQELPIPHLIGLYNENKFTGGGFIAPMALMSLPAEKKPSACIGCRSCEKVCPQQIKISEAMKELSAKATW
jgi:predicted aldo/keto reductase-like oxidoreductase